MSTTRIKICGVRNRATAMVAVEAGASYIGLVFAEASPRRVAVEDARAIVATLPAHVTPVALFVNRPAEEVRVTCAAIGVKTAQLHGHETPEYARSLAPLRVIKAVSTESNDWASAMSPWEPLSDAVEALLCDAAPPPDAAKSFRGGHGQAFDWDALASALRSGSVRGSPRVMLAGGLRVDNVARAIRTVRPYAVDVSSGVESSRGVKDVGMIYAFCAAVREADRGDRETAGGGAG